MPLKINVRPKHRFAVSLLLSCLIGCQHLPFGTGGSSTASGTGTSWFRLPKVSLAGWNKKSDTLDSALETPIVKITRQQEADVQFAQARLLEKEGHSEEAITMYLEVVKRDKSRADAYHRLGILECQMSRYEPSDEAFRKALKLNPKNADICCDFGYSLYVQGRLSEAESMLKSAVDYCQDHNRAHNNLGLVYAHSNRPKQAFEEFCNGGTSRAQAYCNVALALALDGELKMAKRLYTAAIELDEDCVAATKGLKELEAAIAKASESDSAIRVAGGEE